MAESVAGTCASCGGESGKVETLGCQDYQVKFCHLESKQLTGMAGEGAPEVLLGVRLPAEGRLAEETAEEGQGELVPQVGL